MVTRHPAVVFVALTLGFGTFFSAAAAPLYLPVVTVVDSALIRGIEGGKQVVIDPLLERQSSNDVGQFSNDLHRNSGGNNSSVQTIHFEQSQLLTGLIVSNVYDMTTQLSTATRLMQFARLNVYDSNGQNLLSALVRGSYHGIAYVDFGSSVAGIDTITLSGNGGFSGGGPMGMVSAVFVGIPEPAASTLLFVGLLLLTVSLRRKPLPQRNLK